ncbi:MAG: IS30 family transposase [Pseudomonadota bacterium]
MTFKQLTYAQRCQICALKRRGFSCRAIGHDIGVHHTTVSRELRRNAASGVYHHGRAQGLRDARRWRAMPIMSGGFVQIVLGKLFRKWSPQQISDWLARHGLGRISHETIYRYIRLRPYLKRHLRHRGKRYLRASDGRRGPIKGRVDISQRPAIVEQKARLGDWELDTIIGAGRAALVSMVDRASKFALLRRVERAGAVLVARAILDALSPDGVVVQTLTADNGAEFARHQGLAYRLGAGVYFAKPYHAWQRGLNEHTNGLIRGYLPKGTCFDDLSADRIRTIQNHLNTRPRAVLGYRTPKEVFDQMTLEAQSGAFGM